MTYGSGRRYSRAVHHIKALQRLGFTVAEEVVEVPQNRPTVSYISWEIS